MDMVHITYRSGMEANASISIHKKMLEDSRIDSYRMFIVVGKFGRGASPDWCWWRGNRLAMTMALS
jgi:hypothetical protein